MTERKRRTAAKEEVFIGFRAGEEHAKWLEDGARVLGSKSAVLRAVLDEAIAQGMTFGARTAADARKAGL